MPWIYKYVDTSDETVKYVGLVYGNSINNLLARLKQHLSDFNTNDAWKKYSISNYKIYVLGPDIVKTKCDAEMLEAHFINEYKSYNYINTAKVIGEVVR